MRSPTGDRRLHVRFQVRGTLPASLVSNDVLRVVNLATNGALVAGAVPLKPDAEYRMQMVLQGLVSEALVKVRRVREVHDGPGAVHFEMGLEFLELAPEARELIAYIVRTHQAHA